MFIKNYAYMFVIVFALWAVIGLVTWRASKKASTLRKEYYNYLRGGYMLAILLFALMVILPSPPIVYRSEFRNAESLDEVNQILAEEHKFSLEVEEYTKNTRLILSLFLAIAIAPSFAFNRFAKKLVEQSEMSEDVEEKRKLV